jgi:hypothetical protein
MSQKPTLSLALLALMLCASCASHYTITTSSGRTITTRGKPHYDKANSCFVYKDLRGDEHTIAAGSVSVIAPASDKSDTTGFNPKLSR